MEKNKMETEVCIRKSHQTLTTTHLCICSQRQYIVWDWKPKLDLRQHWKWWCGSDIA